MHASDSPAASAYLWRPAACGACQSTSRQTMRKSTVSGYVRGLLRRVRLLVEEDGTVLDRLVQHVEYLH